MSKIDINKLNEVVEKTFDKIFEEEERQEVKNSKPTQWHDDYSNKEEKHIVQTRINPDTKKPEFKIPTNDKVYDTRDAAIAALKESKNKKKVVTINENDICNIVTEVLNDTYMNSPHYKLGYLKSDINIIRNYLNDITKDLNQYINSDKERKYDLSLVTIMTRLNAINNTIDSLYEKGIIS